MEKLIRPSAVVVGQPHAAVFGRLEYCDKLTNIQFQGLTEEQKNEIFVALKIHDCSGAKPFIQGNSNDWLMVEFTSSNEVDVAHACTVLAKAVGLTEDKVPGLNHPDFACVFG